MRKFVVKIKNYNIMPLIHLYLCLILREYTKILRPLYIIFFSLHILVYRFLVINYSFRELESKPHFLQTFYINHGTYQLKIITKNEVFNYFIIKFWLKLAHLQCKNAAPWLTTRTWLIWDSLLKLLKIWLKLLLIIYWEFNFCMRMSLNK